MAGGLRGGGGGEGAAARAEGLGGGYRRQAQETERGRDSWASGWEGLGSA